MHPVGFLLMPFAHGLFAQHGNIASIDPTGDVLNAVPTL
jgi:hypothetical protein